MSQLSIRLLGSFEVTLDEQPVTHLRYNKVRALLAYLAVEKGRPHRREVLATLFWPEQPADVARHSLRQALSVLRRAIASEQGGAPHLLVDHNSIQINPRAGTFVDVESVQGHLGRTHTHPHADVQSCPACIDALQKAAELYRGDFLEGLLLGDCAEFETWAVTVRERIRVQIQSALYTLTRHHLYEGRYPLAQIYARRQIEIEPYCEEAHRQLMRILVRSGQRSAALAQYQTCRRVLAKELCVEPAYETRTLYERIRAAGDACPHNLPPQLTALIGREGEVEQIAERLADPNCRLLTLVGPGGIGKTRLALRAAEEHAGAFLHGVWFVPLAAVDSAARIAPALADALGVLSSGSGDLAAELVSYLSGRDLLLVLDNFEHVIEGAAFLVEILEGAPDVQMIATSRQRLGLRAEWVLPVRGLPFPHGISTEAVERFDAVRLFVERARQAQAGFCLSLANRAAVARICQLVGGVPLGIELAASATMASSCQQIATEIEQSLDALTTTMRDVPERHRSMRAVLDRSWKLLSPEEQLVFANLSVFRGGFTAAAAREIAQGSPSILAALVSKSLLRREALGRYQVHELPRQYAAERLAAASRAPQVHSCHSQFYLSFLHRREPCLKAGEQKDALREIGAEIENVRAAWQWAAGHGHLAGLSLALESLFLFYWARNWFVEGQEMLARAEGAILASGREEDVLLARVWRCMAEFDAWLSRYAQARGRLEKSIQILDRAGEQQELAAAIELLGRIFYWQGSYALARQCFEESLALCRRIGDKAGQAQALNCLSNVVCEADADYELGQALLDESLALAREIGDQFAIAKVLVNQGACAQETGDLVRARRLYEESLRIYRDVGYPHGQSAALQYLAQVTSAAGDNAAAQALLQESLALDRQAGHRQAMVNSLKQLGHIACEMGAWGQARECLDEALCVALEIKAPQLLLDVLLTVANLLGQVGHWQGAVEILSFVAGQSAVGQSAAGQELGAHATEALAACTLQLPAGEAKACSRRGHSMTIDQAVALALHEMPSA